MTALTIEYRSLASFLPRERTPRTHSKKQIRQIADSITAFGWTNPILIDGDGRVVAGHGRLAAAKLLGIDSIPTICLSDMTQAQLRAYAIADNRLAENAGWDRDLLAIEFRYIAELDASFDLPLTGFDLGDIEFMLDGETVANDRDDAVPDPDSTRPAVSRPGDLWQLGPHRLLCGDARDPEAYRRLLEGRTAQMVFTDPPYNVPIDGHVCGGGSVHHDEFIMASGEMDEAQFTSFLTTVLRNLAAHSQDGSIHYACMDWRHIGELLAAGRAAYAELKNLCVWNKDNGGMGSFYRSKHELVFVFKNGTAPHINNFELGQNGRYRTNVWDYPGANSLKAERMEELRMHPTVKPVALVADAIRDCSHRGGLVLDPFAGSGTTLMAAERTGREACVLELDPRYVDTIIRRWQTASGQDAVHADSGETFAGIADWQRVLA
ncbi:site-specific DNA-methyltransferase [Azospirillum doebereinerae]|uniref:Methyltransferase n=1 Tax=Azospirillum doebereinerae TaxID=92933 RepID=A0A3S1CIA1_9PROT|nr:DNA methyltransferase [Azospirillum doebereinerae]RUQ74018.1 DNA methylase N-4 [Azospirillum doebereinerae]